MAGFIIRPEKPADYAAIADVNVRAFDERTDEALMVALQRQRAAFDPDLSLVAEQDGVIVGHALFSPLRIRLMGEDVPTVLLGPISVLPKAQGQGIGAALMKTGHEAARVRGYVLSMLVGHPEYYPRFGYSTDMFGGSSVTIKTAMLPASTLEPRPLTVTDLHALRVLWQHEESEVDFSIDPGDHLLDWLSPHPQISAQVYLDGGAVVGYTRIHADMPGTPRMFLARDGDAARRMAAYIGQGRDSITLPLHPHSASSKAFAEQDTPTVDAWKAAMALALTEIGAFTAYRDAIATVQRHVGRAIWPVAFDIG